MAVRMVGITHYGWKHFDDGTSVCRKWFMAFYLPIVPLKRWKVVSHNTRKRGFLEGIKVGIGIGGLEAYEQNLIEFLEPAPGNDDIIPTYLRFWVILSVIVAFDVGLIPALSWAHEAHILSENAFIYVFPILIGLFFGLPIAFGLVSHQYGFGIRPIDVINFK